VGTSPFNTVYIWTVEGEGSGVDVQEYADTITVDWNTVTPGEYYTITVQEFNYFADTVQCGGVPVSDSVYIWPPPVFDVGADKEACLGDSVYFYPDNTFIAYRWSTGDTTEQIMAGAEGYYTLTVTDWQNCENADSAYLTIHPLPVVDIGEDLTICEPNEYMLDAGSSGVFYNWYTTHASYLANNTYSTQSTVYLDEQLIVEQGYDSIWVEVEDIYGCIGSDTVLLAPCNAYLGEIPNLITPNGDGDNDDWRISRIEKYSYNYTNLIVEIYDRWGKLVWRSEPGYVGRRWDGTDHRGRQLPVDSYFYIIRINNNNSEPITGHVTIVR
jgi:gliding motility-associated-like protein